jgi:hypothetical protein
MYAEELPRVMEFLRERGSTRPHRTNVFDRVAWIAHPYVDMKRKA